MRNMLLIRTLLIFNAKISKWTTRWLSSILRTQKKKLPEFGAQPATPRESLKAKRTEKKVETI